MRGWEVMRTALDEEWGGPRSRDKFEHILDDMWLNVGERWSGDGPALHLDDIGDYIETCLGTDFNCEIDSDEVDKVRAPLGGGASSSAGWRYCVFVVGRPHVHAWSHVYTRHHVYGAQVGRVIVDLFTTCSTGDVSLASRLIADARGARAGGAGAAGGGGGGGGEAAPGRAPKIVDADGWEVVPPRRGAASARGAAAHTSGAGVEAPGSPRDIDASDDGGSESGGEGDAGGAAAAAAADTASGAEPGANRYSGGDGGGGGGSSSGGDAAAAAAGADALAAALAQLSAKEG